MKSGKKKGKKIKKDKECEIKRERERGIKIERGKWYEGNVQVALQLKFSDPHVQRACQGCNSQR